MAPPPSGYDRTKPTEFPSHLKRRTMQSVRRIQFYLEEDLWKALRIKARQSGETVSNLVRQAVRERYFNRSADRQRAMQSFVGSRERPSGSPPPEREIRDWRKGRRLDRLSRG